YYASAGQHNSGATALLQTTSTTSGSPTTGRAQYQLFSGLTGSSVTLTTGGAIAHTISNNIFGFQIVNTAQPVPESSMIMGIVFFGGGLFAVSRRKNQN
ncbi:MAG: PEP-CTERM sorting domain-containing protein, partial [Microcystis panniformis]